ncbi:MAG: 60S ribosomal protein L26 [Candidatus Bathyarchaeia archaeon]
MHPSKVEITRLNLDDKLRKRILERRGLIEETRKEVEAMAQAPASGGE